MNDKRDQNVSRCEAAKKVEYKGCHDLKKMNLIWGLIRAKRKVESSKVKKEPSRGRGMISCEIQSVGGNKIVRT